MIKSRFLLRALIVPVVAGIFLWGVPVQAQQTGALFSGAYLLELCKRDREGKEVVKGGAAACQAYIAGVIDYHNLLRSLGTAPSIDFCVPNTVKMNELQTTVWLYLEKNAQHDVFIAAPAVALGLFEKFPCKKTAVKKKR